MRVSILDDYQKCVKSLEAFQLLEEHQVQILHEYYTNPQSLANQLADPEALILTRTRTPITKELLDLLPNLKVISQTGKNAGHVDFDECKRKNIAILESKGNPIATAELAWSLILNGLRQLPQAIQAMKEGKWQSNLGRRVYGKRIGIYGYGKIGKRIAAFAKSFGAEVVVWGSEDSRKAALSDGFLSARDASEFFSTCDVVSLHLRLKDSTKEKIRYDDLVSMKSDALFVNTARAGLVESGALLKALNFGRPGFAALDVYDQEPITDPNHPLLKMPNVICTPHLGFVERSGYEMYYGDAIRNFLDWCFTYAID